MDFSQYEDADWFKQLKENVSEYYDKNNAIESAKFGYERDIRIPQWILGIGITIAIASQSIISNLESIWKNISLFVYFAIIIFLLVGILQIREMSNRHRIGMLYVYRKKDEQDRRHNTKPNNDK